ncbi:MAG: HDOD domain-containing protein [Burkholderiales bacterium]|nr:HDOD domain-containing protein [Phycisphaerae bacterium]
MAAPENLNPALSLFLRHHETLTGLPENTTRIVQMSGDRDCNIFQLLKLISHDAGLVGRIIQAVNSAYYSLPNKITQLDRAVAYLGLRTIKELSLAVSIASMFKGVALGRYQARDLWDHSMAVALLSRDIAKRSGAADPEEAFLAGMLHDIGLLFMVQSEPLQAQKLFAAVESGASSFADAEQSVFGFGHAEAGAAMADQWKFPPSIREAIRWHHDPEHAEGNSQQMCALIAIADQFCCRSKVGYPLTCAAVPTSEAIFQLARVSVQIAESSEAELPKLLQNAAPMAA